MLWIALLGLVVLVIAGVNFAGWRRTRRLSPEERAREKKEIAAESQLW